MTVTITAKTYTYTNGNANDADQVNTEFVNAFNNDSALKTKVDNLLGGAIEDSGTVTLNSLYTGSSPSTNGVLQIERGTETNTGIRWNETTDLWESTNNGTNYFPILHEGYAHGCEVSWVAADQISIATGRWADSTNKAIIEPSGTITIDRDTSGANGLDTGSIATDTWYYVYLIMKSSDGTVAGVVSVTNESVSGTITQPSGYDLKRQLPIAIRNNGSNAFIKFKTTNWGLHPSIIYMVHIGDHNDAGTNNILATGTATTYTDVDLSSLIPPISNIAILKLGAVYTATARQAYVRPNGESYDGYTLTAPTSGFSYASSVDMPTDSSRIVEYKISGTGSNLHIWVQGYHVDQKV